MSRFALAALLVLAVLTGVVSGADPDVPPAQAAITDDQSALMEARTQRESILQAIREDESHATSLQARLAGGAADLPRIQKDLSDARARAESRRQSIEPQRLRYQEALDHLEVVKSHARSVLEDGADFRAAQAAAASAHEEVDLADEAAIAPLTRSSTYHELQTQIEKDASRVDYFHRAGPAFIHEEQAVSSMLREDTDHLNNLQAQFIYSDQGARKAREYSAAADAALAQLRADIEQRLPDMSEVAAATRALQAEQGPYEIEMAVLHAAEARIVPIQKAYQQTLDGMAADRATLAEVDEDCAEARAALTRLDADIDRIAFDLAAAVTLDAQAQNEARQSPLVSAGDPQPVVYWSDPLVDLPIESQNSIFADTDLPPIDEDGALANYASYLEPAPIFIEWTGGWGGRAHVADRAVGRHRLDQLSFRRTHGQSQDREGQVAGADAATESLAGLPRAGSSFDQPSEASAAFPQNVGGTNYMAAPQSYRGGVAPFQGGGTRGGFEHSRQSSQGRTWNSAPESQRGGGRFSGGAGRR